MEKKVIQEQRMKNYFIQATKELLKSEGLRAVNVRAVADRAGYSYATLYNYFKDLNELIFECVKEFQQECEEYVVSETAHVAHGSRRIRAIAKAYLSYFVQYPGIFELFFIEQMRSLGNKEDTATLIYTFLDRLCKEEWDYYQKQQELTTRKVKEVKDQLKYVTTGMLLFYLNRRQPENYQDFVSAGEAQIKRIFMQETAR